MSQQEFVYELHWELNVTILVGVTRPIPGDHAMWHDYRFLLGGVPEQAVTI
jgi:hypothetical protein